MRAFVLDASIALGWMLDRPLPPRAAQARKFIIAGAIPVVPSLWRHEVSNAVVMSERRGRLTADQVKTLTADLEEFSDAVQVDPLMVRPSVLIEAARRTSLTAYLELGSRRKLPLATLHDRLRQAARRAGLELV